MSTPSYDTTPVGGVGFLSGVLGSLTPGQRLFEPQRQNNALLTVLDMGTFSNETSGSNSLTLSLAAFPLPKTSSGEITIPFLNEYRKFAGNTQYDNMSVTFHDYVDRATARALWSWRYYIHDPTTGLRGMKHLYAKNAVVDLFPPNNDQTYYARYKIEGIWPQACDFGEIDMGSDDNVRIGVTFAIDKVYPDPDPPAGSFRLNP